MATYRGAVPADVSEKTLSPLQGGTDPGPSDISPAVPADVIYKLLGFTFAMVVFPIGSYYFTLKTIFSGNATYAGGFAAVMANVVMIAYVIVAMKEDQSDKLAADQAKKGKKAE